MRCFLSNSLRSSVKDGIDFGVSNSVVSGVVHPFPLDEESESFNKDVAEVDLSLTNSVGVGDIPDSSRRCGVDTTDTSSLELHFVEEFLPVLTA